MYGSSVHNLCLQGSMDRASWTTIWSKSYNQGSAWYQADVDAAGYKAIRFLYYGNIKYSDPRYIEERVNKRYNFLGGSGYYSDVALDLIEITTLNVPTMAPTNITASDSSTESTVDVANIVIGTIGGLALGIFLYMLWLFCRRRVPHPQNQLDVARAEDMEENFDPVGIIVEHQADPWNLGDMELQRVGSSQLVFGWRQINGNRIYWLPRERSQRVLLGTTGPDLRSIIRDSAWVRRFDFATGTLDFVPSAVGYTLEDPVTAADRNLAKANTEQLQLGPKFQVVHTYLDQFVRVRWEQNHEEVNLDRGNILESAYNSMRSWTARQWRSICRFKFRGEEGIDAGGLAREFWDLASREIFDANRGLFIHGETDNLTYQINPFSNVIVDQAMEWYTFAGKLIAKVSMRPAILPLLLLQPGARAFA